MISQQKHEFLRALVISELIAVSLVLLLFATKVFPEHTVDLAWMRGYTDAHGTGCCSQEDCRPAQVRLLATAGEETTVEVNGVALALPAKSVHLSQDAQAYWCAKSFTEPPSRATTRCVFLAIGG